LTLTEVKDENNTTTQTFHDSEKRVVLRRVVLSTENLDTYYIYDEPGQLRFVLQPQFQLEGNLDRFAFMYQYNNRGLVIRKKVPGAGEQTMLYDTRDRLSSVTDARGIIFTHQYDELNRPTQVLVNNNIPIQYTYYDNYGFSLFANGGFVNELGLTAAATGSFNKTGNYSACRVRPMNAFRTSTILRASGCWSERRSIPAAAPTASTRPLVTIRPTG
ncbi:MAG: hypothetical protein EOP50_18895, partial [Sphingobacteriales bacterium]